MSTDYERGYLEGKRRALIDGLGGLRDTFACDTDTWDAARAIALAAEVQEAKQALRDVCEWRDWPEDIHLRDVIERIFRCEKCSTMVEPAACHRCGH